MDAAVGDLEVAYCEARARRYIGDERVRTVCDRELEAWLQAERAAAREDLQTKLAAIRALLLHLQASLHTTVTKLEAATERPTPTAFNAADVPELVAKATVAFGLWRAYVSQEMYGEFLREGIDPMDFEQIDDAMDELNDAIKPFEVIDATTDAG